MCVGICDSPAEGKRRALCVCGSVSSYDEDIRGSPQPGAGGEARGCVDVEAFGGTFLERLWTRKLRGRNAVQRAKWRQGEGEIDE